MPLTHSYHEALQRAETSASLRESGRKSVEGQQAAQNALVVPKHRELGVSPCIEQRGSKLTPVPAMKVIMNMSLRPWSREGFRVEAYSRSTGGDPTRGDGASRARVASSLDAYCGVWTGVVARGEVSFVSLIIGGVCEGCRAMSQSVHLAFIPLPTDVGGSCGPSPQIKLETARL